MDTLMKKVCNIERKVETMETEVILQMDKSEEIAGNLNKVSEQVSPKNLMDVAVTAVNDIVKGASTQQGQSENEEAGNGGTDNQAQTTRIWANLFHADANRMPPKQELETIVKKSIVQQEREALDREDRGKNVILYGVN
jgi:hypothetical protein